VADLLKKRPLRLPLLLAVGVLAIGLSGCGVDRRQATPHDVSATELADGAEPYFWTGNVTYQVQVSRQLNPFDSYDVEYLAGVKGAQSISPQQLWFGIFLWAKNQTNHPVVTAYKFRIIDSAGDIYYPTPLDPNLNPYAWTPQTLSPDEIEPVADSAASDSSPGGGLILFKLNQSVYSNRPLTLLIFAHGSLKPSAVSLDL
jgi:hypothetical protein